jgi:hypothetical protein
MHVSPAGLITSIVGGLTMALALSTNAAAEGMPDILGIQLGMPARDAYAKVQTSLPKNKLQVVTKNFPTIDKPVLTSFTSVPQQAVMMGMEGDSLTVYVTLPPNKQAVWYAERNHFFPENGIAKATLLNSLRKKYGKGTVAWIVRGTPTTDDSKVTALVWLFDEQGHPGALPSGNTIDNCSWDSTMAEASIPPSVPRNWCHTSFIAVVANLSVSATPELYDRMTLTMVNVPFGLRAGDATVSWKKDIAEGAHKRDIEKGKQQEEPKL